MVTWDLVKAHCHMFCFSAFLLRLGGLLFDIEKTENVSGFGISVTDLFIHLVTTPNRLALSQPLPEMLGHTTVKTTGRVLISQERGHLSGTK